MTKFIGRLLNVGIGKESTRGTAVGADFQLCVKSFSHEDKVEYAFADCALGVISEVKAAEIVGEWAEGSIEAYIGSDSFGLILLALLGTVNSAVASGETTVYDHTFTLQEDAQHDSLTIEMDNPNKDLQFPLGMIDSLSIAYERGKILDFSVDFMSKKGASSAITPSYAVENVFRPQDFSLKLASAVAGLTGASVVPVESFSITFEKNLEMDYVLGDTEPQDILNKMFNITGEFTLIYDSTTYEDYVLGGTKQAIRVAMVNTDVDLGVVTTNPGLTFDLEPCALTEVTFERGLNDIVKQTITFRALYNQTTSKIIDSFVLTNSTATY